MNTDPRKQTAVAEEAVSDRDQSPIWAPSGRLVFGPWCLLGAWPAVFGVVEKSEEKKQEEE